VTRDEKIAAGWVETAPNRWRIPDADPVALRTDANGFRHDPAKIRETADGFAIVWRAPLKSGQTSAALSAKARDHRSMLADPARRDEWRAERRAANRARSFQIAARRAEALAESTMENLIRSGASHRPVLGRVGVRVAKASGRIVDFGRIAFTRRESVYNILAELDVERIAHHDDQTFAAGAYRRHSDAAVRIFAPVVRAADRARDARYRQNIRDTETALERQIRLQKQRDKVAASRARAKARAATT
jgi:hypothetical protein